MADTYSSREAQRRIEDIEAEKAARLAMYDELFANSTKYLDKTSEEYKKAVERDAKIRQNLEQSTQKRVNDIIKHSSMQQSDLAKRQCMKDSLERLEQRRKECKAERDMLRSLGEDITDDEKERLKKLDKEYESSYEKIRREKKKLADLEANISLNGSKAQKKALEREEKATKKKAKKEAKITERDNKIADAADKSKRALENANTLSDKFKANASFIKEAGWAEVKANFSAIGSAIMANLSDSLGSMINEFGDGINNAIKDVTSHRTKIMARLQGLGGEYDYDGLVDKAASNFAVSPYVKQQDFMQKLDDAVDKGIAYNVEQRTFLATISDKIATTFDAFDSNLLRLIRLQQADSTAARIGMEAALTKTLNTVFSDTSYLSDMYDQVSAAILDSESIMSRDNAAEYEYVVQKWLGSLYSLGVSNNTINQIAQGLNYIGTGNVSALAGNSPLQTLFAMSASRSNGLNYADLLTGGLTAEKTNELLKSMVEYLQEIAENSGNNVVKSAYGDIYQMSLADMRAVSSLTSTDISSIYSQNMSYSDMSRELNSQLNSISKRMSTGEIISNIVENFVYSTGAEIADSAVTYAMWQITDLIQNATGGINLPAISVMGNMVDLSAFTIEGIIKTGIVGMSTLGQISNIISSISNRGGLDLSAWGGQEYLTRGKAETTTNGWTSTTSGSAYVGSSSASDMKNSSIAGATEDAEEVSDITNANNKTEHTFDEFFEEVLINGWPIYTKSVGDYDVSDLYSKMYIDKTPTPVTMSTSDGIGAAIALMAMNSNKVSDVNIKSADVILNTSMVGFESKFKDSIKQYLKTEFVEVLAEEIRRTVVGSNSGDVNTIAKVCQKVLNDSVDVVIKNNNFDNALDRYYMMGI